MDGDADDRESAPRDVRPELRRAVESATTVPGRLRLEISGAGHALSAADHGVGLLYPWTRHRRTGGRQQLLWIARNSHDEQRQARVEDGRRLLTREVYSRHDAEQLRRVLVRRDHHWQCAGRF